MFAGVDVQLEFDLCISKSLHQADGEHQAIVAHAIQANEVVQRAAGDMEVSELLAQFKQLRNGTIEHILQGLLLGRHFTWRNACRPVALLPQSSEGLALRRHAFLASHPAVASLQGQERGQEG